VIDGLQGLVEVSRVDTELAARERERVGVPAKRAACAEERARLEARRDAAKAAVEAADLLQRHSESDARDKEALLAKLEGQQHQIKSNEAYTALLHEMAQAREAISEAETRILEAMDAIEQRRSEAAALEQELLAVNGRLSQQERLLDERERTLEEEIAELRKRREDATRHLDAELLDRYERIAGRRSPAIAIVSREICLGCRVDIPPQRYIEILRGEELITCGHCQRILIHEDQLRQAAAR
jgi:uncharacterized protein